MLQKQDDRAVGADQADHYNRIWSRRLTADDGLLAGTTEIPACAAAVPEIEIGILGRTLSRFVGGLLRCLLPGLLAGACLAWPHGGARAAQATAQHHATWVAQKGIASYYGRRHQGHRTASGTSFDKNALTAAHPWLPFGTKVRVTADNGRSVVVTITDRLPSARRVIDLSLAAARVLGIVSRGLAQVSLTPV